MVLGLRRRAVIKHHEGRANHAQVCPAKFLLNHVSLVDSRCVARTARPPQAKHLRSFSSSCPSQHSADGSNHATRAAGLYRFLRWQGPRYNVALLGSGRGSAFYSESSHCTFDLTWPLPYGVQSSLARQLVPIRRWRISPRHQGDTGQLTQITPNAAGRGLLPNTSATSARVC